MSSDLLNDVKCNSSSIKDNFVGTHTLKKEDTMKLKEFFKIMDEAKERATPRDLEEDVHLYVSNADLQAEMQRGEYGDSTKLTMCFLSGNTLHVMG
jgi:hypothetical protein